MTPWKVLIVDDEEGIHGITRMIFRGYEFESRPIELISATNSEQAKTILKEQPDIALALLDVVMEQDNTGLLLVEYIRKTIDNQDIRIILRTGHPGYAPEAQVIVSYDINDYLSKAELSASRLLTSVIVALRSYRDIRSARNTASQPTQTTSTNTDTLLPLVANHFESLVSPLLTSSQRLQQMGLNPVAQELSANITAHIDRLQRNLFLLKQNNLAAELKACASSTLIDPIVALYMPQMRQEGWFIDYQIEPSCEQITTHPVLFQNLVMCAIELALANNSVSTAVNANVITTNNSVRNDLKITLNTGAKDRLIFRLEYVSGQASFKPCRWSDYLQEQLSILAAQLDGQLIEPEGNTVVSCDLPLD